MPLVQVRDVPQETVDALKARAAGLGLTLAAFVRAELDRIARQPSTADVLARIEQDRPELRPSRSDIVAAVNRLRETS